jgi:DNA-binding response OmpR family regulator
VSEFGATDDCRGRILLVDDCGCTRDTLSIHLRGAGYGVVLAASGEEGLLEVRRGRPDVVVLDHHLPDMDGFEWLRQFRRQRPDDRTGVLLFTADWEVEDRSQEFTALGAMLASKLCDVEEVLRLVDSLTTMRATLA